MKETTQPTIVFPVPFDKEKGTIFGDIKIATEFKFNDENKQKLNLIYIAQKEYFDYSEVISFCRVYLNKRLLIGDVHVFEQTGDSFKRCVEENNIQPPIVKGLQGLLLIEDDDPNSATSLYLDIIKDYIEEKYKSELLEICFLDETHFNTLIDTKKINIEQSRVYFLDEIIFTHDNKITLINRFNIVNVDYDKKEMTLVTPEKDQLYQLTYVNQNQVEHPFFKKISFDHLIELLKTNKIKIFHPVDEDILLAAKEKQHEYFTKIFPLEIINADSNVTVEKSNTD